MNQTIKQLEEKNVANEIEIAVWSSRMDLVAISNVKGEVALHRLTWIRAWTLPPHKEGVRVKGIAWRPDSKIIAIGYSTEEVFLVDVENTKILHKMKINGEISCMFWAQTKRCPKLPNNLLFDDEDNKNQLKYPDNSSMFLTDLQSLSTSTSQQNQLKPNSCENQKEFNILITGTEEGKIYLSIFGKFLCAIINLSDYCNQKCSVVNANFSNDLSSLFVIVKLESGSSRVIILNTDIFRTHKHELFALANKHSHIDNLISYLWDTINAIKETWERILIEMDTKLKKYASNVPEGTLAADFLDLLLFGITSTEMQEFLLHDLTEKGLKKFGQVIETCYSNMQQLILKNLTKIGQNVTYHLAELRGMTRLKTRFEVVGLNEEQITKTINLAGAFLSKGGEMQQIINQSMIKYKAFFRWLYMAIVNLMEEQVSDMLKMTQQDITNITEFILNFNRIGRNRSEDPENSEKEFTMEKLGQYLENAPLTVPVNIDENIWNNFLMHNDCLREHPDIIKRHQNSSLVQLLHLLQDSVKDVFEPPKFLIPQNINLKNSINCLGFSKKAELNPDENELHFAVQDDNSGLFLTQVNADFFGKSIYIYFCSSSGRKLQISDFSFYNTNLLSVLLEEDNSKGSGILFQLPISAIQEKMFPIDLSVELQDQNVPTINGFHVISAVSKNLEDMACSKFAVSGARKVSVVISKNRKKVKLFEMEADEEEDDDADMTSSIIENNDL